MIESNSSLLIYSYDLDDNNDVRKGSKVVQYKEPD